MVAIWSDGDPTSFDREPKVEIKANLCLTIKDDEVCNDELDYYYYYYNFQNEYECLFNDFEKLIGVIILRKSLLHLLLILKMLNIIMK